MSKSHFGIVSCEIIFNFLDADNFKIRIVFISNLKEMISWSVLWNL